MTLYGHDHRRRGYGLDLYHAAVDALLNTNVMTTGLAIFIAGFSSIFTGLNFIVTIHRCARRA
jgi:hypothetical protein